MTDVDMTVRIEARPSTVFRHLVDAEHMVQWMGTAAELDARPGGVMTVTVNADAVAQGEFVEVVTDRRVVFTWGWTGNNGIPPGSTTVEIDLTPDGDDTIVRLRHTGLPDSDAATRHTEGWTMYLGHLVALHGA